MFVQIRFYEQSDGENGVLSNHEFVAKAGLDVFQASQIFEDAGLGAVSDGPATRAMIEAQIPQSCPG